MIPTKSNQYVDTAHVTFFEGNWTIDGTSRDVDYPGVSATGAHLQASSSANSFQTIIENDDPSKSILISRITVFHGAREPNPIDPYVGTFACAEAGNDLFRYSVNSFGNDCISNTLIALPPATSLLHYSVLGPTSNKTYSIVINYRLVSAVEGVSTETTTTVAAAPAPPPAANQQAVFDEAGTATSGLVFESIGTLAEGYKFAVQKAFVGFSYQWYIGMWDLSRTRTVASGSSLANAVLAAQSNGTISSKVTIDLKAGVTELEYSPSFTYSDATLIPSG